MTIQEKCVVTCFTGKRMCSTEDICKYAEKKLGRQVFPSDISTAAFWNDIKSKSFDDFVAICEDKFRE